ncbi:MAG: M3 family metallopeptidase [Succinivibrionaceae bacterium]|nr:M3 family metallopeptidase [Succinivibrionaceae bacterium]
MANDSKQNPLLSFRGLPRFSEIRPEHVRPAIEAILADCRKAIEAGVARCGDQPTWDSLLAPIEEADDHFSRAWTIVNHLNQVKNTDELREAYEQCIPLVSEYLAWAGHHKGLFDKLTALHGSATFRHLSQPQQKAIENSLRDFRLSGIDLPEADKRRYVEITTRLSELSTTFSNHLLDATHDYTLHLTAEGDLCGLPQGLVSLARAEAQRRGLEGWVITLDHPSYVPFLTYSERRDLRQAIYEAYATRASELGPSAGKFDNQPIIEETLRLRHELARLLGFGNHAEVSLYTKMAKDPGQVMSFLGELARRSRPQGGREMQELAEFAAAHGAPALEPWDIAFWSERLKQERYAFNEEELRPYFPVPRVMKGLFETARRLYGVSMRPRMGVDVWDPEVRCYEICDSYGATLGTLYVDLYAREGKRGGAWMEEGVTRRYCEDGTLQLPVTFLVCNFTPPVGNRASQLTHSEVVTLFHEFGHSLNHLLTRIDVAEVSGIQGVPWDAVELPSQLNENFAWQEEVLSYLSGHATTGAPLPHEKVEALLRARNFESAMAMLRQLEFALFDFRIHLEYDPAKGGRVYEILNEIKDQVAVVPRYPNSRFPDSFSHVFAGGYDAGYYSYKWAEVLAADAFGRFEEEGVLSPRVGADFCRLILSVGGAADPLDQFRAFRGRDPEVDALLRQSGIEG